MSEQAHLDLPDELTWNEIMALWAAAREHDAYVHRSGKLESERETTQLIESGLGKLRRRFHALNLKDVVVTGPDGATALNGEAREVLEQAPPRRRRRDGR